MRGRVIGSIAGISLGLLGSGACAQDARVGITASITGPFSVWGKQYREGIDLFLADHGSSIGRKLEIIYRDVGGPNPARSKQLAQELVVRDKVAVLGGHELTPNVLAVTDVINQAKIPFVIFNTGTAHVTDRSPYFVRVGFTQWVHYYPLGIWAGQNGLKRCVSIAADYAPGHDSLEAIKAGFTQAGGEIISEIRVPLEATDFSPYLQRIRDAAPECTFVFMPLGPISVAFTKAYTDRGLLAAGIKLLGQSETVEFDLPAIGDAAVGVITAEVYGPYIENPVNAAFVKAYQARYGADQLPSIITTVAYDGMRIISEMLKATDGKPQGDAAIAAIKGFSWQSPRGPVTIDPETREPIQNVYIRQVVKENGRLYNKTIHTYEAQREPWHELQKKGK
ncbi:MAG: ABC transporter substrate-binding protein [Xanthobacteraceae bacterium]